MSQILLDKMKKDFLENNPEFIFKKAPNVHPLEQRLVLRNCKVINPESIIEYIARDGYQAIQKTLDMTQEEVITLASIVNKSY